MLFAHDQCSSRRVVLNSMSRMFASTFRSLPAAIAPAARLAAARPRLSPLLAPHSLLPNAISSRTLGALFARPIITVNVNQGTSLYTPNDPASRSAMLADISRQEEIALSQFNRLVMEEMHRGTLKNGARRMKRFARYLQPTLARRDKRARAPGSCGRGSGLAHRSHGLLACGSARPRCERAPPTRSPAAAPDKCFWSTPNVTGRAAQWRKHKQKMEMYMNWIQCAPPPPPLPPSLCARVAFPLRWRSARAARDVLLTSVRLPSQIVGAELLREYYGNGGWGVFRRLRSVTCT